MEKDAIITKVQFNLANDARLYSILNKVSKRKRAYMVKKMLNDYLQIQDVLTTYNNNYSAKEFEQYDIGETELISKKLEPPLAESIEYLLEDFSSSC